MMTIPFRKENEMRGGVWWLDSKYRSLEQLEGEAAGWPFRDKLGEKIAAIGFAERLDSPPLGILAESRASRRHLRMPVSRRSVSNLLAY